MTNRFILTAAFFASMILVTCVIALGDELRCVEWNKSGGCTYLSSEFTITTVAKKTASQTPVTWFGYLIEQNTEEEMHGGGFQSYETCVDEMKQRANRIFLASNRKYSVRCDPVSFDPPILPSKKAKQ